jgi:hypothetical protein
VRWFRKVRNILAIVLLALLAWYAFGRLSERAAARRLEAKVRQKGEPLTLKGLAASVPEVADDQNAATGLIDVWTEEDPAFWRTFLAGGRPGPPPAREYEPDLPLLGRNSARIPAGQLSPAAQQALDTYLKAEADRINALRSALSRRRARFPVRYEEAHNMLLPHLTRLKTEAQIFRLKALRAAQTGDVDESLAAINDIIRLSKTLANEPIMISQLVRAACVRIALDSAEDLLSRQTLSPDQLQQLDKQFVSVESRQMLRLGMLGERVMALSIFDAPEALFKGMDDPELGNPAQIRRGMGFLSLIGMTVGDRRLILETIEEALSIADDPSPRAFERAKKLEASTERKLEGFPPKIFAVLSLPAIGKATERFMALEAVLRGARLACAIEGYRLQHAKLPDRLADTILQIPMDPFDGQPFRYQFSATGYVVYSVGPDLRDNRGVTRARHGIGMGDETFRVNR